MLRRERDYSRTRASSKHPGWPQSIPTPRRLAITAPATHGGLADLARVLCPPRRVPAACHWLKWTRYLGSSMRGLEVVERQAQEFVQGLGPARTAGRGVSAGGRSRSSGLGDACRGALGQFQDIGLIKIGRRRALIISASCVRVVRSAWPERHWSGACMSSSTSSFAYRQSPAG